MRWIERVFTVTKRQIITIDGNTVRRSHDKTIGKDAIHMVRAWESTNGITLEQRKVDEKLNEITAPPELLRMLGVAGCIVTTDAMGIRSKLRKPFVTRKRTMSCA